MFKLVVYRDRRRLAEGLTSVDVTNAAAVERAMAEILRQNRRREQAADCWAEIFTIGVTVKTDQKVGNYYPGAA